MSMTNNKQLKKVLFAGLVILSVIFAFILFLQNNAERATYISVASLKDSTLQSTQRIDDLLNCAQKELELTAELYEELLESPVVTAEDLATLTEKSPFSYIEFVNSYGIKTDAYNNVMDVSGRDYFKDGMNGNSGIEALFDPIEKDEHLVVFYTPLHYNGNIIGVLMGFYTETQVKDILYGTFFGENSRTFLCAKDGSIIASCNALNTADNVFDATTFNYSLSNNVINELRNAFASDTDYEFQYQGTDGLGNAYVTALDECDWMLIQTFPSQVTTRFIRAANKSGLMLLAALICIFALCLAVVQISGSIQKKRLMLENAEKTYVIDGITQLFGMFVLVDFTQNTYKYLAGTKPRLPDFPLQGDYISFSKFIVDMVNDEDERARLSKAFSKKSVQKNLDEDTMYLRYEYRCKFDTSKWDSVNFICIKRNGGVAEEVLVTCQDVSKIKEREQRSYEALKEAYQAVEGANRAKSDFLSNMSHDIRTPMNAIMGMTAIAAMNIDNPERIKDCLNKITVSSQHLLGLINEVLDMSKIESGRLVFMEEEFSLSDVVERMVTMFLPQTQAKNQHFNVNISDVTHEEIIGDSMRLQQIFVNILGNAVKFTPENGNISFGISEKPSSMHGYGCYVFTFEDTGIGMEKSFIDKIFEPFMRAENSRVNKIEGTGLGMPIVKNIVQMMNGDIQIESKLNEGSKFTVTVYLQLNHSKHDDVQGLEHLSVLVADDDQFACENACIILTEIGMDSDWVLSGDEAIEKLLTAHNECKDYSAVILDWKMPDKDGLQTAKEIRARVGEDVPIIILSAFDYSEVEQEARDAGVNAFISKPLFRSRLIYVMKTLILGDDEPQTEVNQLNEHNYSGKRVLLVEDNELNIEIASELLSQTGITVETALNGQLAVELVNDMPPNYYDLIFMDIQMPVMNGYEAAAAIRASERQDLKTIPIVAMSADTFSDDIKHAKAVGMNGHVAKPVEIDKLVKALDEWI